MLKCPSSARVPQVFEPPSTLVPLVAKCPGTLSYQVSFECPSSAQVPFECLSSAPRVSKYSLSALRGNYSSVEFSKNFL